MNYKHLFFVTLISLLILNSNSKAEPLKAEIILDKTEYEQGEKIAARLNFEGKIFVWGGYHWSIQKWEDDSWTIIEKSGCEAYLDCEELYRDEQNGLPPCRFILYERPMWYKINGSHPYCHWEWDQTHVAEEKTVKCWNEGLRHIKGDEKIDEIKCYVYSQVPTGRYKMRVEYAITIDESNPFEKEDVNINYTEKEFIIKK